MAFEISKNRGDSLTIAFKILSGNFYDICVSFGKEIVGKISDNTLEIDINDDKLFYCKLSSIQTSKYISKIPIIVAVDYDNMGVRKFKQEECLKILFLDNVNPFTNNSKSLVVDATIYINQIVEEITMDVNLATLYRGYRGFSAYEVAVQNGFEGTEQEWLDSLKGGGAESMQRRLDIISNIQYIGLSDANLLENQIGWKITKIIIQNDGTVIKKVFENVKWSDRLILN